MMRRKSDEVRAALLAFGLLAVASAIAFVIQPDPQGEARWFFALLPGAYAAPTFLDLEWRLFHHSGPAVAWGTEILFSYVWYFVVAFVAIKLYRLVKHERKATHWRSI